MHNVRTNLDAVALNLVMCCSWRQPEAGETACPTNPSDYLAAIGVPISVPITSPEITISTRRFCCRPSAVSLEATG
jgi:hypothetical protein